MKLIYSLSLFIIILIPSCRKEEEPPKEYRLTPEDLTWNIYHKGDTVKFLSNYNHNLVYVITGISQNIHDPSSNDDWNSYEDISIGFCRLDSANPNKNFSMSLVRGYPGDYNRGFSVMVWGFYGKAIYDLFSLPLNPNVDTLKVENILYHDVYKATNPIYNTEDSAAKNMFYEKQKGWLRFEINTGEIWDRIN
jgi:hypothetical protein